MRSHQAILLLWLSAAALAAPAAPDPAFADVKYGPHERNVFDLWPVKSGTPAPLVVYIHGGGFVSGDKEVGRRQATLPEFLRRGIAFASINYRYRRQAPIQDVLRDCARAIQFMRLHAAEYNIDPARVGVYGGSAGAGTSLWLAFHDDLADPNSADPVLRQSSRVQAAGAMHPQFTYDVPQWEQAIGVSIERFTSFDPAFYGLKTMEEVNGPKGLAIRRDVDMSAWITRDDPPVLMISRLPDTTPTSSGHLYHHPRHVQIIQKRLEELGMVNEVYLPALEKPAKPGETAAIVEFFSKHLK